MDRGLTTIYLKPESPQKNVDNIYTVYCMDLKISNLKKHRQLKQLMPEVIIPTINDDFAGRPGFGVAVDRHVVPPNESMVPRWLATGSPF